MTSPRNVISDFVHGLDYQGLPTTVQHQMRRCLLDLVGVAAAGSRTRLSRIMRDHAHRRGGGGPDAPRLLFDGRRVDAAQAAMANAATIDSLDGHDGHRLAKGHAGVAVLPAALAFLDGQAGRDTHDLIAAMAVGYEISLRAGLVLHDTTADYHGSGAWNALGAAAVGARLLALDTSATWHALGIAEYTAPRAPVMRAIAHPTMVKDGSAWGAQAGVAAALLAADGFTGAPAGLIGDPHLWADLGYSWRCLEQYFKPWPVCRWAHPAVRACVALATEYALRPDDIVDVHVTTFEEATRLSTSVPETTEEAQYSLSFAVAAALATRELGPEVTLAAGAHPDTRRLMERIRVARSPEMSAGFPAVRQADVRIGLSDGRILSSGPTTARGDPDDPLTDDELVSKFRSFTRKLDPIIALSLTGILLEQAPRPLEDLLPLLSGAAPI